ncbi:MAG: iron-sulfur cluster carrier protein ApbC [Burkholderiaceae bacterium]|nr:iron-sulfur cluster carrier protein ApbC [Burkholderiaceae bacterium]
MSTGLQEGLRNALARYVEPNLGLALGDAGAIESVEAGAGVPVARIVLGFPVEGYRDTLIGALRAHLAAAGVTGEVAFEISARIPAFVADPRQHPLPEVGNVIAVASGKGGVGKSTVAANLALALAAAGARTGLLDADIYGPSQPMMLGISGKPESIDGQTLEPMENYGLQVSSIGLLIDADQPMVWRGPMVTQALQQLLGQTNWKDVDYLVVDMPPGTGDIQLTLAQQVPVTGAVIVTTPQDIALIDARKGLKMFEKVSIPILGIVENMAVHVCSKCGHTEHIFGAEGGKKMAEQYGVDYLGSLPLDIRIREQADAGRPTVVADPDSPITAAYKAIARKVAIRIAEKAKDMSLKMPTIKVSNT